MRSITLAVIACLALAFCCGLPCGASAADAPPAAIKKISIEGNRLIEQETIRTRLKTVEGALFSPDVVSEDIHTLFGLGYFDDVKVDAVPFEGGLEIKFIVDEKPLITSVQFEGNKEVKEEDLRKAIDIKSHSAVNEYEIKANVERLVYALHDKGFYRAQVSYRLKETATKQIELIFSIAEGAKLAVSKIIIKGTVLTDPGEIKKAMKTNEAGLFSYFTKSGTLRARELEEDQLRILYYLYNHGHLKARVEEPKVTIDEEKHEIIVTVEVLEGPRFKVGKLTAPDDEHYTAAQILSKMETKPGAVFSREIFAKDLLTITNLYTDLGYAFCNVDSESNLDEGVNLVNVKLIIEPGPKVKVGRIHIIGNQITRDNVVRREMTLREGQYFSSTALATSRQKIMNLGFFDKVDITTNRPETDVIDITVEIKERLTGTISFGVGYSSESQFGGIIKVTQDNLFGRGQKIQASADFNADSKQFNLYFYDPSVFDSPYSFGIRAYNTSDNFTEYDRKVTGGQLIFGRSLGELFHGSLTFKDEVVKVYNLATNASKEIEEQKGTAETRSISARITRDSRDNFFYPTTGSHLSFDVEYAGDILGGDNNFLSAQLDGTWYYPLWKKLVFSLHGQTGVITGLQGSDVPLYERFYLGGINSLRGFSNRDVGPKDENGDPIGGYKEVLGNAELIFPISEEQRLSGVFFFDAGNVYGQGENVDLSALRYDAGAGLRWLSPIGPFRLEWGYNIAPQGKEDQSQWQFSIGTAF